jgi:hypothetical protein
MVHKKINNVRALLKRFLPKERKKIGLRVVLQNHFLGKALI